MGENPAAGFGEISRLVGIEWSKLNGQQKLEYSTRAQQNIAQEKGANNVSQSHFDERETEAPIPHKRPRNDFIQTSATVFGKFFRLYTFFSHKILYKILFFKCTMDTVFAYFC